MASPIQRIRSALPFGTDPATGKPGPMNNDQLLGHTAPAPDPGAAKPRIGVIPIGASGRANFYGLPQWDELNPKLIGVRGLKLLDEMYRTDSHIRRLILAGWSPVVAGTWTLEPYGGEDASQQDRDIADAIWWLISEFMSPNFQEHLLTLGPVLMRFGFAPFELVNWQTTTYKGKTLTCPKKLDVRMPWSVWRWWQDDFGELTHIGQILPNKPDIVIPVNDLLYYRLGAEGDNWMGQSLLRHAYKHWYLKDKFERLDAVGQERRAVGVPIVYHSPDVSPDVLNGIEQALAQMHMSEVAYMVFPGWKMGEAPNDAAPGSQFLVDVIQYDSSSGPGIQTSIDYHQTAISASFLTDFLELGHHQVGARATAEVQEDPFLTAINGALLPPVIPPLNRFIDLIRKTNWDAEGSPTLKLTLTDQASLSEIATFVLNCVQAEAMEPDTDLEDWLRNYAGLPAANKEARAMNQAAKEAAMKNAAAAADQLPGAQQTTVPGAPVAGQPQGQDQPQNPAKPRGQGDQPASQKDKPTAKTPAKQLDDGSSSLAAGVIVHARDTGRVLIAKRTTDEGDPHGVLGSWEFPGGKLDPTDQSARAGAVREWQEETGATLPDHQQLGDFASPDGAYHAFVVQVPHETDVPFGASDRKEVAKIEWRQPGSLDSMLSARAKRLLPGLASVLDPDHDGDDDLSDAGDTDGDRQTLDAPTVPPNYRTATDPAETCHTCRFINPTTGECRKYGVMVDREHVCDSWSQGTMLDDAAMQPLSGGTASADGLQMVPELAGSKLTCVECGSRISAIGIDEGHCRSCGEPVPSKTVRKLGSATGEPTVKWFERLLSQDQLRAAFDGCRDHIQAAAEPQVRLLARQQANQAANGAPMTNTNPPTALVDALTQHYAGLYQLGSDTVTTELAKQRHALARTLDDPADTSGAAAGASRLGRARARGEHSARNILSKINERLGRDQITGLKDPAVLQQGAEQAAMGALRVEALANTTAMVNDGRNDAGQNAQDVVGAYYTSVLDQRTCGPCEQADDGSLLSPEDAVALGPPNPDCDGADFCRCALIWVLSEDPAALQAVT